MQAWAPHQANVHDVGNFGKEAETGAAVAGAGKDAEKGKGKGRLVGKLRRGRK